MPARVPRLVKDHKTGIWFFRWTLPKTLQQLLDRKTLYQSLQTRDARHAQCQAALLNIRVEGMKKIPTLDESAIRRLLHIDLERGVFQADTAEEQERGLRILENLGRLRSTTPTAPAPVAQPTALPSSPAAPQAPSFKSVCQEVLKYANASLKSARVYKYKTTYDAYVAFAGNPPVNEITRQDIRRFKDHLIDEKKAVNTINTYLGKLHALFDHALKNQYMSGENPASNQLIARSKRTVTPRDKFYDEDLKAIFSWKTYSEMARTPDYFWGPLVCLFSGMRIGESTSLEVRNIKTEDDVVVMQVKDAKTPTGDRLVPVHSALIRLGFLDYVNEVRQLGHEGLFWYLSEGASGKLVNHNGTKKNLSRQFSSYLKQIGVKQDDNCFHSLRHTTITRLVARKVNNSTIYKLSGHTSDNSMNRPGYRGGWLG